MKRNDKNNPQGYGYPQQNGYPQDIYQGYSAPQGYQAPQGYPQGQGYNQAPGYTPAFRQNQGYQQPQGQPQGYSQAQGYSQTQGYPPAQGFQAGRNYQTPQVPTPQAETASDPMAGQAPYTRNGYPQAGVPGYGQAPAGAPGYGQAPAGVPGTPYPQQNSYQQPNGYTQMNGYPQQTGYQAQSGSYIPQTPSYTKSYTAQGYPAANGYQQGYTAYNTQMGRNPQPSYNPTPDMGGQVPLNGGGYVPQPVPVRKQPFQMKDSYLLIASAVLLILFALGMFAAGMSFLKWPFIILAAGTTAALWIKPMTDDSKRLCYTIVFGLLVLVTIISIVTGGMTGRRSGSQQAMSQSGLPDTTQQPAGNDLPAPQTAQPVITTTPSPEENQSEVTINRAKMFIECWSQNDHKGMLQLSSPKWVSGKENAQQALFYALGTKTPVKYEFTQINGTVNDTSRAVIFQIEMNNNNGKPNSLYSLPVMMVLEEDTWYVDPESLRSNEPSVTPAKPTMTAAPTPVAYPDTVLYYNPDGGTLYHIDPNCSKINKKYLPLQGHFMYKEIDQDPYNKLDRCNVCGAPLKPKKQQ